VCYGTAHDNRRFGVEVEMQLVTLGITDLIIFTVLTRSVLRRKICSKLLTALGGQCLRQILTFATEVCAWQYTAKLE
jgi:hypothetical protein